MNSCPCGVRCVRRPPRSAGRGRSEADRLLARAGWEAQRQLQVGELSEHELARLQHEPAEFLGRRGWSQLRQRLEPVRETWRRERERRGELSQALDLEA